MSSERASFVGRRISMQSQTEEPPPEKEILLMWCTTIWRSSVPRQREQFKAYTMIPDTYTNEVKK
jgi:hypothetical protein